MSKKYLFHFLHFFLLLISCCTTFDESEKSITANKDLIINSPGLIAFWDFEHETQDIWSSFYDAEITDQRFPIYLRQIGDEKNYTPGNWPYSDSNARLLFDESGPFGKAVLFNKGYIYGAIPREAFDQSLLNIHGRQAFTLIAWVKFVGQRHMIAGIWDEGGWNKYRGRRQVALFAGLFNQKGVIGHVSATGAASYPQSEIKGAQYARIRAIDPQAFENEEWIAIAMSFDPKQNEVKAYLNGKMKPFHLTDPVTKDVYRYVEEQSANPLIFNSPIYSPRHFVLKYNGYNFSTSGVHEHLLRVNLNDNTLKYQRLAQNALVEKMRCRISFDVFRDGKSILAKPVVFESNTTTKTYALASEFKTKWKDEIRTTLEVWQNGSWQQQGSIVTATLSEGAPFTFGRALGLASEELDHGSQLFMDGVAVFNRVLEEKELKAFNFR